MSNRKGDIAWGAILAVIVLLLVIPSLRTAFIEVTDKFPYISGFIKFFILASMGDLLGVRILKGRWIIPKSFLLKGCVWGVLGMAITLAFTVYMSGAAAAQAAGKLPFEGYAIAQAFFGSLIMNVTFGPMLYIYHKIGDYWVDNGWKKSSVKDFAGSIDWESMVGFFWRKTCLLIWVPCHTAVFLLPPEYRVVASAFLSIVLGVIIAFSKKKQSLGGI